MTIEQLPLPSQPSPEPTVSIERDRVANHDALIAPFQADEWPLGALPLTAGAQRSTLTLGGLPTPWTSTVKWLAYRWLNFQTPSTIRDQPGSRHVDFPSPGTVRQRVGDLRAAIVWLIGQGVTTPSEVDDDHLTDLVMFLREESTSPAAIDQRLLVFKHWHAQNEHLPAHLRLREDLRVSVPSESRGVRQSENKTRRVRQDTMGPLLWWATNIIDDYAEIVFGLLDRMSAPLSLPDPETSKSAQSRAVLDRYVVTGDPLPTWRDGSGEMAGAYLAWRHGLDRNRLAVAFSLEYADVLNVAAVADCPVPGFDLGVPDDFAPFLQFYDIESTGDRWPRLVRMLQTACLIVVAYLTGMRPDEVRRLRPGCCPPPISLPGGGIRHLIHGTVTKRQAEADGLQSGTREEVEAAWATIALAARAVALAERIKARFAPESEWLFNSPHGQPMLDSDVARTEIQHFIDIINSNIESKPVTAPTIPADTHGPITLRRFRRTLAWYIRNQPEGEVTLGVQFQHIGTVIGGGYAAAGSSGWADLLDEEGIETRRQVAESLGRELLDGAGISGPAAARATYAASELMGVSYLPDGEARRLLNAPGLQIYDNKSSLSLCMFDPDRALCQQLPRAGGGGSDPNLLGCRLGCANRAMTDAHAAGLANSAQHLRQQAVAAPTPMHNRLTRAADEADERVAQHWATRVVPTVPVETDDTESEETAWPRFD